MKTLLVTGGCGFIGSNFVRLMLKRSDYAIINVDALTYAGNLQNLKDIAKNRRYTFARGRIEDAKFIQRVMKRKKISAIVHFAAESHVDRSITDAAPFIKTNVVGTHVLLEAAKTFGVKKFIHISTDEVYGSLGTTGKFTEQTPLAANSPYSASKAAADLLVRSYIHTHKLPAIIVRCSNNYGPYQFPEKFIPQSIVNALRNKSIPLYGDGKNVRDWIFVEDFCDAIALLLHKGKSGEIYNVGGECELKNRDVLKIILRLLKKPFSLIAYVKDRPGHDRRYAMDIRKIKREFGWKPSVRFEQGIQKTIEWYVKNQAWWQQLEKAQHI